MAALNGRSAQCFGKKLTFTWAALEKIEFSGHFEDIKFCCCFFLADDVSEYSGVKGTRSNRNGANRNHASPSAFWKHTLFKMQEAFNFQKVNPPHPPPTSPFVQSG